MIATIRVGVQVWRGVALYCDSVMLLALGFGLLFCGFSSLALCLDHSTPVPPHRSGSTKSSNPVLSSSSYSDVWLAIVAQQLGYVPSNYVRVSAWNEKGDTPIAIQTYPLVLSPSSRRRHGVIPTTTKSRRSMSISRRRSSTGGGGGDDDGGGGGGNSIVHQMTIGTPFPTLYWFTCPHIGRAISHLERDGYLAMIQTQLRQDEALANRLLDCHHEYAHGRWHSLSQQHQRVLLQEEEDIGDDNNDDDVKKRRSTTLGRMREMLQFSGIAGTNLTHHHHPLPNVNNINNNNSEEARFIPSIKCLHTHYAHYRSQLHNHQQFSSSASIVGLSHNNNRNNNNHDDNSKNKESGMNYHYKPKQEEGSQNQEYLLNPVGQLVHQQLQCSFPDLLL